MFVKFKPTVCLKAVSSVAPLQALASEPLSQLTEQSSMNLDSTRKSV